ncbi:MAG: hypothetical protein AAFP98_08215 [Pseudomonadota bacterium]
MKQLLMTVCVAVIGPSSAFAQDAAAVLEGTWESIACELRPQPDGQGGVSEWWLTRNVTFTDGRIEARFTTYAGPGCDFALSELHFAGAVNILGPSDVAEDAVEADLVIDEFVNITPLAQGFADFLNGAPEGLCGADWVVGEAQDILPVGCALLDVAANEPTIEYEILSVQGDHVYFGARRIDGAFLTSPDLRPKALLVPARRVN